MVPQVNKDATNMKEYKGGKLREMIMSDHWPFGCDKRRLHLLLQVKLWPWSELHF